MIVVLNKENIFMKSGRIAFFTMILSGLGVASQAYAGCDLSPNREMVAQLNAVPDVKVGQTLATLTVPGGGAQWNIYCSGNNGSSSNWILPLGSELRYGSSGFSNVYVRSPTSKYGVRFKINGVIYTRPVHLATLPGNANGTFPMRAPNITLEIVKVRENGDDVFSSISGLLASSWTHGGGDVFFGTVRVRLAVNAAPTPPTCTVDTPGISIPLGDVQASSLATVGATSPISPTQNVVLSCMGSPSVSMTLQGSQASGAPDSVLALKQEASVAKGIGVQLLYRNNPLAINTSLNLTTAAPGKLNVPIAARYYRIGDMEAGLANAAATLRFTYN
jgi:type 1 fimbria pilin